MRSKAMIMTEPHLTRLTRCEWLCRNRLACDGGLPG
jgi:hypothetical protein